MDANRIGARSRGAAAPLEIFWPPWATFAPPETFILGHFWDKKRFLSGEDLFCFILFMFL